MSSTSPIPTRYNAVRADKVLVTAAGAAGTFGVATSSMVFSVSRSRGLAFGLRVVIAAAAGEDTEP